MNAAIYINFATALVTFIFGLLLLTGMIYPGANDSIKLMFGIVLMIYGVYRFVNTISKIKQTRMQKRAEMLNKEREKMLNRNE